MKTFIAGLATTLISAVAWADLPWMTEEQIQNKAGENFSALEAACEGDFIKPPKTLLKSALSGHIPRGDWRRHDSDDGSCSLIGGGLSRAQVSTMTKFKRSLDLLAGDGSKIATFRLYDILGIIYKFRYYTTNNICRNVSNKAKAKGGTTLACVKFSNGCACANSVLGRTGGIK